jgi:glycosyltransferase involved in cell wall biosynthesis
MEGWQKVGMASRELAYYDKLSECIGPIQFVTYGSNVCKERLIVDQFMSCGGIVWNAPKWCGYLRYGNLAATLLPCALLSRYRNCVLVRSNQFAGAWTGYGIARRLRVPFILRCGYLFSEHYKKERPSRVMILRVVQIVERVLARAADAIIVTYRGACEHFQRHCGVNNTRIHVLGNPIDTEWFAPTASELPRRDVVFVGRLSQQKNLQVLLHACSLVKASLTVIGDGDLRRELTAEAESLGLDAVFAGCIPNRQLPMQLNRHRLFVLPSLFEGNPKALLEAMACGLACVASRIPEHSSIIKEGVTGWLSDATPVGLSKVIESAMKAPVLRSTIGNNARAWVVKEHGCREIARKEGALHRELLCHREAT